MHKTIFCIDLKAFYASIECVERHLDVLTSDLAVIDIEKSINSICLSVSNHLKIKGTKSRCRFNELPKNIVIAKPRMKLYIEKSCEVLEIFLKYISYEDIHIYSIDEAFLDVTKYLKLYNMSDIELARTIVNEIYEKLGLIATCGISFNLFMAKCCLDNDAKKNVNNGYISKWTKNDIKNKLWKLTPLNKMWGIGKNQERKLNLLGINTVGDLANYDVNELGKIFGIIGEELYHHANGEDYSEISESLSIDKEKSLSVGETLSRNYTSKELSLIIKDAVENLCVRLRKRKKIGNVVSISICLANNNSVIGGSIKIGHFTQDEDEIYNFCKKIVKEKYRGEDIRKINVSLGNLINDEYLETSLFDNLDEKYKIKMLNNVLDEINEKYNKGTIYKARNILENSTYLNRRKLIGGHNAE